MKKQGYDYVVVGAGAAGCVLAGRLAEAGATILLLEAGGHPLPFGPPAYSIRNFHRYMHWYESPPQSSLLGRRITLPQARVIGGGTAINGMLEVRGGREDYDGWREEGNPGWGFDDVLPYFKKSEDQERGPSEYHGVGGPIPVSDLRYIPDFAKAITTSSSDLGLPTVTDFNGPSRVGLGYYQHAQRRGRRATSARFLRSSAARRNVHLRTHVFATGLLFEGRQAKGIEISTAEGQESVFANEEVLLSAGALSSPHLLMLSGIGPADELKRVGIDIRVDLPGVGKNIQDHIRVPVIYENAASLAMLDLGAIDAALMLANYYLFGRGLLNSIIGESGGFACVDSKTPSIQWVNHWTTFGLNPPDQWGADLEPCLVMSESRGELTLLSNDPHTSPLWSPNFLAAERDVTRIVGGIELSREIANTPVMREFGLKREITPGPHVKTAAELADFARSTAGTCFHPSGSCKMGPESDPMAVVDSTLKVRGIDGLRVVDASVMPRLIAGNTASPTRMIAEKAAAMITREREGREAE